MARRGGFLEDFGPFSAVSEARERVGTWRRGLLPPLLPLSAAPATHGIGAGEAKQVQGPAGEGELCSLAPSKLYFKLFKALRASKGPLRGLISSILKPFSALKAFRSLLKGSFSSVKEVNRVVEKCGNAVVRIQTERQEHRCENPCRCT